MKNISKILFCPNTEAGVTYIASNGPPSYLAFQLVIIDYHVGLVSKVRTIVAFAISGIVSS